MCMRHGMRQGSAPRFPRTADSGGAQESEAGDRRQSPWRLCGTHASFFMSCAMCMQHSMPRAPMWSAREVEIGPEPSLTEACSAARVPNRCAFRHAALPACYNILIVMCMQHGMHEIGAAGSHGPISGPARSTRHASVWLCQALQKHSLASHCSERVRSSRFGYSLVNKTPPLLLVRLFSSTIAANVPRARFALSALTRAETEPRGAWG